MEKQNYGGLDNEFTSYKDAKIVVLPVPYDGTSTWLKGADGAGRILRSGRVLIRGRTLFWKLLLTWNCMILKRIRKFIRRE